MIYVLIEGTALSAEFKFHRMMWSEQYADSNIEIVACNGNRNLEKELKARISYCKNGDSIFICYDYINSIVPGGTALLSRVMMTCRSSKIPCYLLKYFCFEDMIIKTGVPESLLNFAISKQCSAKICEKYKELLALIRIFTNALSIANILYICEQGKEQFTLLQSEKHFVGTVEAIIKRTCSVACAAGRVHFKVESGNIGECWIEPCTHVRDSKYSCNRDEFPDFECILCRAKKYKSNALLKALAVQRIEDLFAKVNIQAINSSDKTQVF